jgi:hypothetical protein
MPKKRADSGDYNEGSKAVGERYEELQQKLIENLVELQKVHTNLAEKFDKLSDQITTLLRLFEMAAKSFASVPGNLMSEKDKDFLEKIDKLLDQNKTIAKGLMLIEEKVRERMYGLPQPAVDHLPSQVFTAQSPSPVQSFQTAQSPKGETKEEPNDETISPSLITKPLPRF